MVYIVLRSGKVLQYNSGGVISVRDGCVNVFTPNETGLVARIPLDIVERAEFERPCCIRRAKGRPKRADY